MLRAKKKCAYHRGIGPRVARDAEEAPSRQAESSHATIRSRAHQRNVRNPNGLEPLLNTMKTRLLSVVAYPLNFDTIVRGPSRSLEPFA